MEWEVFAKSNLHIEFERLIYLILVETVFIEHLHLDSQS